LNRDAGPGYDRSTVFRNPKGGGGTLNRFRIAILLVVGLGLTLVAGRMEGKDAACDIGIQSSSDVNAELSPCG
jgi:hypothetical protein